MPNQDKPPLLREALAQDGLTALRFGPPAWTDPNKSALLGDTLVRSSNARRRKAHSFVIVLRQSCGEEMQITCINYALNACSVGRLSEDCLPFYSIQPETRRFAHAILQHMISSAHHSVADFFPTSTKRQKYKAPKPRRTPVHAMRPNPRSPLQCIQNHAIPM